MDEQGVSSIVTLQEMGFTEVRLRDTLMRATNATGLFSDAQQTATSAWQENVALSNETGKRYATMTGAQARWNEFAQNPGAITTAAIITGYGQQEGVEPPKLETVITISGYDLTAYRQFMADNPIEVEGVLRLSEVFSNPEDALTAENVDFWQNGVEIPASLVPKELLTPDKVAVLDADGTMHILITPKIEGTAEAVSAAGEKLDENFVTTSIFGKNSQHDWGVLNSVLGGSLIDWMRSFTTELKAFDNYKGTWATLWGLLDNRTLNGIDKRLGEQFSADNIAGLQTFVSEMVAAIQNGEQISEEDLQKLQTIVDFLSALELAGIGENITAGIGDAMSAAGWDADAESVAGNLEAALNAAFVIHSPSQRVKPIGENVAPGVGEGMAEYDLSADAEALADQVKAAIEAGQILADIVLDVACIFVGRWSNRDQFKSHRITSHRSVDPSYGQIDHIHVLKTKQIAVFISLTIRFENVFHFGIGSDVLAGYNILLQRCIIFDVGICAILCNEDEFQIPCTVFLQPVSAQGGVSKASSIAPYIVLYIPGVLVRRCMNSFGYVNGLTVAAFSRCLTNQFVQFLVGQRGVIELQRHR